MQSTARIRAFTLIELLIVVAIIGILAAIAVPNFLNAQMRAKIARVEAELRSMDTALESYRLDNNVYPPWRDHTCNILNPFHLRLIPLSTPIAYIGSIPGPDPLHDFNHPNQPLNQTIATTYDYVEMKTMVRCNTGDDPGVHARKSVWRLASAGPDGINTTGGNSYTRCGSTNYGGPGFDYHSSNGLRSFGDIVRTGARADVEGEPFHYGHEPCNR